eukprot:7381649-Prymnesium_polylepis.1
MTPRKAEVSYGRLVKVPRAFIIEAERNWRSCAPIAWPFQPEGQETGQEDRKQDRKNRNVDRKTGTWTGKIPEDRNVDRKKYTSGPRS